MLRNNPKEVGFFSRIREIQSPGPYNKTPDSYNSTKVAIECKNYSRPVGVDVVNSFGAIGYLLKTRGLVDKVALVSTNGFTHQARASASEHNILLIEVEIGRAHV